MTYPLTGLHGANILSLSTTNYNYGMDVHFSLAAQLAKGSALKIKITSLSADTTSTIPTDTIPAVINIRNAGWFLSSYSINWLISNFDTNTNTQTFTAIEPDKFCDLNMQFEKGSFKIDYFEMNATEPTRTKIIHCK